MPWKSLDGLILKGPMNIRILVAIDNFNRSHKCASQQKSPKYSTWVQNQKRKMISVHFQGKPFSIRVIQVCALTTNAEEAEEDLQDLLELLPKKDVLFIISSVQSLSRVRLFETQWTAARCFPIHYQLPELTQTHVHLVDDTIQPSHSLSSPSPPTFNLSQHQGLFK